ncbi:MAG: xanthine dehydrogenase family protein molybdopterin-binding subunit, partial [Thermoanaerobaculales bacterium]
MSLNGRGRRRQEGAGKVDGSTRFTADLEMPGLLHVQLVLSHLPSARIRGIDTSAARSAPGVVAVVTGADLPDVEAGGPDKPLAIDRVYYAGQPVAAVVAESEAAAIDAAVLVEVDYEPLEVVSDPEHAMREGSPLVLEPSDESSEGDASMHGAATDSESEPVVRPRNVSAVATFKRGDAGAGLKSSDTVIKATYRIAGVHHSFIEPHVSMVRPEPGGGMTIWAPTQGPFMVRDEIAKLLDAAPHEIRVIPMPVGGGFGGKVMLLEAVLALLARKVRRPLRLTLTRQQEFMLGHPAPAALFDIELGAKSDGTLVAL